MNVTGMNATGIGAARDFGNYLRNERELRGISLSEMSGMTKIPSRSLELLEGGDWAGLPGGVFVKGFVKSYARYLGIDDEAQTRFSTTVVEVRHEEERRSEPVGEAATGVGTRRRFGLALFVIILLIIVTITFSVFWGVGPHASFQASAPSERCAPERCASTATPGLSAEVLHMDDMGAANERFEVAVVAPKDLQSSNVCSGNVYSGARCVAKVV